MKPLRFTRHARNRMRLRQIAQRDVVDCVTRPDVQRELPTGEVNCWKTIRGDLVRVVYVEEGDTTVIITVIFPAKLANGE